MSRSYRKNPGWWFEKMDKKMAAQQYRAATRNLDYLHQGSAYKKVNRSGDWNAWCRWTKQDAIQDYHRRTSDPRDNYLKEHYPTLEDYLKYWYRIAKRK